MSRTSDRDEGNSRNTAVRVPGYPIAAFAAFIGVVVVLAAGQDFWSHHEILYLLAVLALLLLGAVAVLRIAFGLDDSQGLYVLIPTVLLWAGFAMFPPVWAPRPVNLSSNCQANIHSVYLAMKAYAEDHDGKWPAGDRWCDLLLESGYLDDPDVLRCPATGEKLCGYALNSNLEGRHTPGHTETVLLFETDPRRNGCGGPKLLPAEPRHLGGLNFVFEDGTLRHVPADEFGSLRWVWKLRKEPAR
jgi:hypothetical protein